MAAKTTPKITPETVAEHGLKPEEYQRLLDIELGNPGLGEEGEEPFHLGHHFGANAVAGEEKEFFCAGHEMTALRLSRAAQC